MKNVQAKFTDEEYARIRSRADEQGKTLGEFVHDAALWVDEERRSSIRNSIAAWREQNPEFADAFSQLRQEYLTRFRGEGS